MSEGRTGGSRFNDVVSAYARSGEGTLAVVRQPVGPQSSTSNHNKADTADIDDFKFVFTVNT